MNAEKTGALIRALRTEQGLTQKQLADRLHLSDRTVSKWERGAGCPDVSLLGALARELGVDPGCLLAGELGRSPREGGNMKRIKFYVCPVCGEVVYSTGNASVSCCGRPLAPLDPAPAGGRIPCSWPEWTANCSPSWPIPWKRGISSRFWPVCSTTGSHSCAFGPSSRPRRACLPCAGPTGTFTVPATGCSCKRVKPRTRRRGAVESLHSPPLSALSLFRFRLAGARRHSLEKPFRYSRFARARLALHQCLLTAHSSG